MKPLNLFTARRIGPIVFGLLVACVGSVRADESAKPESPEQENIKFFDSQVAPILQARCFRCHGSRAKVKAGLRLTSRKSILVGGDTGPAVSLQQPEQSLLLEAINYQSYEMPPNGKLSQQQIDILTRWVRLGVPFSTSLERKFAAHTADKEGPPQVTPETRNFWSFRPVQQPAVPAPIDNGWVTNPIDAFVLARLQAAGLQPSQPADKAVLLRRVCYDLIGLPPSTTDVRRFLDDESPDAYEQLVDRLLESVHYGEKSARHWLDLVRYAETNSYERDGAKPFVWRYRDYVIRSFNEDKPYDQFIREQLAGDELEQVTAESIIATGYYRLGIWDDEPSDPEQAFYDDLDDILSTTAQTFFGLTMGCARCHDHKLDPIPQSDYYSMLAFFRNIRRYGVRAHKTVLDASVRTIARPEEQQEHARAVEEHQRGLRQVEDQLKQIEDLVRGGFSGIEKDEFKNERARVPILKKRVPKQLSREKLRRYTQLTKQRNQLRDNQPVGMAQALCVKEHGPQALPTHVLVRGNAHAKGKAVEPSFPSVLGFPQPNIPASGPNDQSSRRRLVLANWIASERNPLTARVIVNRVWQQHFGRGIVPSPNNFGLKGQPPTHASLLDWLASEFIQGGWRFKRLHKQILMSSTYRMSSPATAAGLKIDPTNELFWRFNPRRLTAEEIRDSILAVNGSLNRRKMFGPSIYTLIPAEVLAGQSRPGAGWGQSSVEDRNRRSIYIHVKRSLIDPMLASFDAADTDLTCPVRFATTQPTQALEMLNSDSINRQAQAFANFLQKQAGSDAAAQVQLCLERALQRPPTRTEIDRGVRLITALQQDHAASPQAALKHFCVVAFNLNEFLYLD